MSIFGCHGSCRFPTILHFATTTSESANTPHARNSTLRFPSGAIRLKLGCKLSKFSLKVLKPVNDSVGSVNVHASENRSQSISPVHRYSFTRNSSAMRFESSVFVFAGLSKRSGEDASSESLLFFLNPFATFVIPETTVFTKEDVSE
jgi:hypothetical protein